MLKLILIQINWNIKIFLGSDYFWAFCYFLSLVHFIGSIRHWCIPWLLYFFDCVILFLIGDNRWVYYIVLIPDGCNRCLKFFNIIHFWFFCLFLFVTIFILGEFACLLQISTNKSGWPLLFTVESRIRSSIIFFIILFFAKFLQKIHFSGHESSVFQFVLLI